jgi:hypothetical protein
MNFKPQPECATKSQLFVEDRCIPPPLGKGSAARIHFLVEKTGLAEAHAMDCHLSGVVLARGGVYAPEPQALGAASCPLHREPATTEGPLPGIVLLARGKACVGVEHAVRRERIVLAGSAGELKRPNGTILDLTCCWRRGSRRVYRRQTGRCHHDEPSCHERRPVCHRPP